MREERERGVLELQDADGIMRFLWEESAVTSADKEGTADVRSASKFNKRRMRKRNM
jgi:hypothetical protein